MVGDRGLFVTVDGPSGVGKTTVSRLLGLKLEAQGLDVLVTATPSGSKLGSLARGCTYKLRGMALTCLVAADRYHHDWEVVRPALAGGAVVVCDRYVPSSLVLDVLDGIEPKVVQTLYGAITVPDVAIVLTGDPAVCATRAGMRGGTAGFTRRMRTTRAAKRCCSTPPPPYSSKPGTGRTNMTSVVPQPTR